jgi:hypothetical protein
LSDNAHAIDREHPEYAAKRRMWSRYRDLYAGGEQFCANAHEYLVRRSREPQDVYGERLNRVFYENYIGSIIDWYAATLLRREPVLLLEGHDEAAKTFYSVFAEDCDLKGTNLPEFFRQQFLRAMIYGETHIAIDFPQVQRPAATRAEEDASGRSRGYLVEYSPEEVINWAHDDAGSLEWAVVRTSCLRPTDAGKWKREKRWIKYDRETYQIYREGGAGAELTDQGRHGLACLHRVPLFTLKISEGLWLMNKGASLQLEHFNKSNALSWALTMGLFAMPVVYSDREWNQMVGESYYIQLGPEDKFGWTEPEGHVYQIAADHLGRLKDEIYRVCYLMSQAATPETSLRQSGISKLRDLSITHEVLRAYGDAVKETMKQTLRTMAAARQDALAIEVSGMNDFDIGEFGSDLEDARKLLDLGIGSETMKQQLFKKLVFKYFCDASQETKNAMAREIDMALSQKKGE